MTRSRRPAALVAALLLVLALATVAVPSAGADPAGTVQITPTSGGTVQEHLRPVAGSANAVVYQTSAASESAGVALSAQTSTGRLLDLGDGPPGSEERFSLVGNTLTTAGGFFHTVYWWNLASGTHGTVTLPGNETWQTGAPGGFVYRLAERLFLKRIGGATTDLGRPFVGQHPTALADGTGLLSVLGTHAEYETFAHPGTFRSLATGGHTIYCKSIASGYAACATQGHDALLLPLDGRASRLLPITDVAVGGYQLALSGSTIIACTDHGYLHSRTYSSATSATSTVRYDIDTVSAFGRAVVLYSLKRYLVSVASATSTPSTVVTAPDSPPVALTMSLSPGQLVYDDNRRTAAVPPASSTVFRQPLSTSAPSLTLGTPSTISSGDLGDGLASGTTTVHASQASYDGTTGETTETLVVRGPHRMRSIPGVLTQPGRTGPQLSGNRVLYTTVDGAGHDEDRLYDLVTDSITVLPSDEAPVLSGDYLAYATSDGAVEYQNLVTAAVTEVAGVPSPPAAGDEFAGTSVRLDDGFVAWTWSFALPGSDGDYTHETYDRDLLTMDPPVELSGYLVGLSASGPILFVYFPEAGPRVSGYVVQQADGSQPKVLYPASTQVRAFPNLQGRTVAWIDRFSQLKVAPVDITPAAPRYEGDLLAPAPANPDTVAFHPYAPYSEQLSSCSVAISGDAIAVRTLPCNSAEMAYGVADAVWDGKGGDGATAPAGTYTYTITAAGDGGHALDADGNDTPVTGTFTI